jgi:predicted ester cyclase
MEAAANGTRRSIMHRFPLLLSVVVVVLLGLATSWQAHVAAQEASPAAGDVEAVARQAIEALDQALTTGDTTAIDAVFAPEYVDHTPDIVPTGGGPSGREEMKTGIAGQRSAIPDLTISVEDVLVDGDQAAVRFRVGGTLDPAAMGMPGAVQPLDVGGIVILRIADGQVVESWDYDEFAEQLMGVALAGQMGTPMAGTPTP